MAQARSRSSETTNSKPEDEIAALSQRIKNLLALIEKKNEAIRGLELHLQRQKQDLDKFATTTYETEKALEAAAQAHQSNIAKFKSFKARIKQSRQRLQQELQQELTAEKEKHQAEIKQYQEQINALQQTCAASELDNSRLHTTIMALPQLAQKIQDLKAQYHESNRHILQQQQEEAKFFARKLGIIARLETLRAQQVQELSQVVLDRNAKIQTLKDKIRVLRQGVLDLRESQTANQVLIADLHRKAESVPETLEKRFEEQAKTADELRKQLEQTEARNRNTVLALKEKNNEVIELALENAFLKVQIRDLQNENSQATPRHSPGRGKWLLLGAGTTSTTVAGLITGFLGFATLFWNPVGWTLLCGLAFISAYCFYQAKPMPALFAAAQSQQSLSTTAQLAVSLGGEAGLHVQTQQPQTALSNLPETTPASAFPVLDREPKCRGDRRSPSSR